jgi:hypothetical protein
MNPLYGLVMVAMVCVGLSPASAQSTLLKDKLKLEVLSVGLEHFPFSVNRGDSQGAANKILWPSRSEEAGNGVFERSASSSDPGC